MVLCPGDNNNSWVGTNKMLLTLHTLSHREVGCTKPCTNQTNNLEEMLLKTKAQNTDFSEMTVRVLLTYYTKNILVTVNKK